MELSRAPSMASSPLLRSSVYRNFDKPFVKTSSILIANPRKFSSRKNYLRQKLLKTLPKPYPNSLIFELNPENKVTGDESSPEENYSSPLDQVFAGGGMEAEEFEVEGIQHAEVSQSVNIMPSNAGKFCKDWFCKFGLWLVGAFVFQTVCAVWVLGSADNDAKNGYDSSYENKGEIVEVGMNGRSKSKLKLLMNAKMGSENYAYLGEEEMEKKIEEIQFMAREARERERLKMKVDGSKSNDGKEDEKEDFGKSGIEKEVKKRLLNLHNRLERLPIALNDDVKKADDSNDDEEKNDLNRKEGNPEHIFKKKYKFKGSLKRKMDKPKGFMPSDHSHVHEEVMKNDEGELLMDGGIDGNGVDIFDNELELGQSSSDSGAGMSIHLQVDEMGKQTLKTTKSSRTISKKPIKERENRMQKKTVGFKESNCNGFKNQGKALSEQIMSRKSALLETAATSREHDLLDRNDGLKRGELENHLDVEMGYKKSGSEINFWWLGLPYVLVVLMRRGLYGEGHEGLFTLRSSNVNSILSHTVAFEDHRDATNFCYLLQSFFEGLKDFSTEVVPLTIKELDEAVKSDFMKVIVVKKGQLKLYAGQPLLEVEMALRSLVGQS